MKLIRRFCWVFFAAAGFALAVAPAGARQAGKEELPRRPSSANDLNNLKNAPLITPAELPRAKEAFAQYAKYLGDLISTPAIYKAATEFSPDPRNPVPTLDQINNDYLARYLLIPTPDGRVTRDQVDYVREFGAALDAALKKVIEEGPTNKEYEQIVRLNAARLLSTAARSGAPAHYPTITSLLKNPGTPPEVKVYALKAAENLLSAYHMDVLTTKKRDHSATPKDLVALIQAIEDVIVAPNVLVTGQPAAGGAPPPPPTPDQLAVMGYIRRQAVKTLAQCRFASVTIPPGGPTVYPAHTLTRVIYNDAALNPAPSPGEIAEATLGLLNMTPTRGYVAESAADVVATGLIGFVTARAARPEATNKDYPWRAYAARLTDGLRLWAALFDPAFDPSRPTAPGQPPPAVVAEVAKEAVGRLLNPMDRLGNDPTARIDVPGMTDLRDRIRKNPKRTNTLFKDAPATSLDITPRKP
jgi:hypothetical protein